MYYDQYSNNIFNQSIIFKMWYNWFVTRVSKEPLPKISVGVGGTDLVQHVVRADHRGDVWETHVVIVVLKELFLVAQFSEIMTPSTEWEPLTTRQQVGKEQLWHNNCKIKIFYVYLDRNFLIEAT